MARQTSLVLMSTTRIKEWLIAAFVGAAVTLSMVMFFTAKDNILQIAKQRRDKVADLIKKNQRNDLAFLQKNLDERKKIVKDNKKLLKEINVVRKKEKLALLEEKKKQKKVFLEKQNFKRSFTDAEKIISLTHQIVLLEDFIVAKENVVLAKDNVIVQQKKHIEKLSEQRQKLLFYNSMLELKLKQSHKVQKEALYALNANMQSLHILTARDKAMKIGLGVGIPLAVVGGFLGGLYLAKVVKITL